MIRAVVVAVLGAAAALAQGSDGLPNFKVVNDHILRGGQPTDEAFQKLAERGVKTVVDLRWTGEHDISHEKQIVETDGMRFVSVPD